MGETANEGLVHGGVIFCKTPTRSPGVIFFSQASYGGLELGWLDLFSFIGLVQFGVYGDVKEATLP